MGHMVVLFLLVWLRAGDSKKCGVPEVRSAVGRLNVRIVGGRDAVPGSWPWQVSLRDTKGHFCGGTLIKDNWILTAAHCVSSTKIFNVTLGAHDLNLPSEGTVSILSATKGVRIHRNFNKFTLANDIALVKLRRSVELAKHIQPACLPKEDENLEKGELVYVTGWGNTGGSPTSQFLKQVMVPVIDRSQCSKMSPNLVPPNSICTGFPTGGHNPCRSDSGGPLVHNDGDVWYVHGVVSWGPRICGTGQEPAVYVRVSSYISWIDDTINRNSKTLLFK